MQFVVLCAFMLTKGRSEFNLSSPSWDGSLSDWVDHQLFWRWLIDCSPVTPLVPPFPFHDYCFPPFILGILIFLGFFHTLLLPLLLPLLLLSFLLLLLILPASYSSSFSLGSWLSWTEVALSVAPEKQRRVELDRKNVRNFTAEFQWRRGV